MRPLSADHVDAYIVLGVAVDAGSGVDGGPHSHPYDRSETRDLLAAHERELARWSTPVDEIGWRRAWGLFDGPRMVGSLYLAGDALRSALHRADMGMGILASHRRRGGGSLLLEAAIDWARAEPTIAWIDLGVFTDNPGARALYERHGFREIGRTADRFRVDGVSIDDVTMTLAVG